MNTLAFRKQLTMDIKRTCLRNPAFLIFTVCMPIAFYLMFTKMFDLGIPAAGMNAFYIRCLMSMTTYSVLVSSLYSFGMIMLEDRTSGGRAFTRLTPVSKATYYGSKVMMQLGINMTLIMLVFSVGKVTNHIQLSGMQWLFSGLWILFSSLPLVAVGSLLVLCKNTNSASVLANLIMFPAAIIGGLWWPLDNFPQAVQTIGKMLPTYHGTFGANQILLGKVPPVESFLVISLSFIVIMICSLYLNQKRERLARS